MRFEDERYVRAYTRDTTNWLMLSWQARTVFLHLLRKFDRAGIFEIGNTRDPVAAIATQTRLPKEVVEEGLSGEHGLLRSGEISYLREHNVIFCKNFMAAQEAVQSNACKQRAKRERQRARARLLELGDTAGVGSDTAGVADGPESDDFGQEAEAEDFDTAGVAPDTAGVEGDTKVSKATLCDNPSQPSQPSQYGSYLSDPSETGEVDPSGSLGAPFARAPARTRARETPADRAEERLRKGSHPDAQFLPPTTVRREHYEPSAHVLRDAGLFGGSEVVDKALRDYRASGRLGEGTQAEHDKRFGAFLIEAKRQRKGKADEEHGRPRRGAGDEAQRADSGANGADDQASGRKWGPRTQRSIERAQRFLSDPPAPAKAQRS